MRTLDCADRHIIATDISDDDSEEPQASVEADQNGFVKGPGITNSVPEWQLAQIKQEQRLQKWRSMLGMLHLSKLLFCMISLMDQAFA